MAIAVTRIQAFDTDFIATPLTFKGIVPPGLQDRRGAGYRSPDSSSGERPSLRQREPYYGSVLRRVPTREPDSSESSSAELPCQSAWRSRFGHTTVEDVPEEGLDNSGHPAGGLIKRHRFV